MASRLRLLECECGCKVRMSRAMMLRVSVSCDAGHLLTPADDADERAVAALACSEADALAGDVYGSGPLVQGHRVLKRGSGVGRSYQCRACRKFIASPRSECTCGFDNAAGAYTMAAF